MCVIASGYMMVLQLQEGLEKRQALRQALIMSYVAIKIGEELEN